MNFKKLVCTCIALLTVCYTHSADVLVYVNGTVVTNSCSVTSGSAEQYVKLGTWDSRVFSASGSNTIPVAFTINLENCNGTTSGITGATVTFSGTANAQNTNLFALNSSSTATNVGIELLDENKNIIVPNSASDIYTLDPASSDISLTFYGQYVSTASTVTAGSANADVTFTLTYQ